ncbi:hypothetical protein BD410DRAFT_899617 [Rickenella mellea]|uniref:Uncharacterized protein n=1 Tax=Rickenella mellea TaxID=50990 RepID=A0A4Y7PXX0_9AGAM|nr:hypothetical protein BD410DRAFT_899617 [Rickenella mellea]
MLQKHKYIQVRGVPASGKTTLARLLHRHILEVETDPFVVYLEVWRRQDTTVSELWRDWLSKHGFRFQAGSILIVDEAQTSYYEQGFWLTLKNINDSCPFLVITFASHGSAGQNLEHTISPFRIRQEQNVSLLRRDFGDGVSIGLFLSRREFNSLISRSGNYDVFDATFLDYIYDVTNGHVGACCDVLRAVQKHPSFHSIGNSGNRYSYKTFTTRISTDELMENLRGLTLFVRGLPFQHELQEPDIAMVFQKVLENGSIVVWQPSEDPSLQECFHEGWLHNEPVGRSDGPVAYTFATPLHRRYVQWMLLNIPDI